MKTKAFIESQEWDKLVTETYGRPYILQQQDGCMGRGNLSIAVPSEAEDFQNDSVPEKINGEERGVSFAAWLKRDPSAPVGGRSEGWEINLFWHRNFYPELQTLANDLHAKGLLPAGEHTINIDW